MNKKFFLAVLNILTLCIIIGAVSLFLVRDGYWIGFVLILLSILCLLSLLPFRIGLKSVQPDIFFGIIDNTLFHKQPESFRDHFRVNTKVFFAIQKMNEQEANAIYEILNRC